MNEDGQGSRRRERVRRERARRGGEGPTVADVASLAGVSTMTVSRVVNKGHGVAQATRDKVEQAIAQLNYIPNAAARSLAGRGQCRLALLYDNPSAAFMSELVMGCLDEVRRSDAQLLVEPFDQGEPIPKLCSRLTQHRIDGVLLPALVCDDLDLVAALLRAGFAVARVAATRHSDRASMVGIDDEAAALAMTARLIALGHRRIGFIAGPRDHNVSSLRLAGYRKGLAQGGIDADPALVAQGDFTYRSGMDAAEALLAAAARPTAIFASNDDMAAAVIAVAHRRQLDVPGELSVCGFDDTPMARSIWPEITTIRQPVAVMARRATALLLESIQSSRRGQVGDPAQESMDFALIPRESDAPPRA